jgi:hypothetical protein
MRFHHPNLPNLPEIVLNQKLVGFFNATSAVGNEPLGQIVSKQYVGAELPINLTHALVFADCRGVCAIGCRI